MDTRPRAPYRPPAMKLARAFALCASLLAPACAGRQAPPMAGAVFPETDARVGQYVSSAWGFSTSTFWIEGPEGVVLIDTQFLPSAATEAVDAAERATGKKVLAAIVLHANPDKFNGTATLQARGIRVLTSAQVLERIPHVFKIRTDAFGERYRPDWPRETPRPESFGDATAELSLAGLTLRAHVLGPGCSEAHVVVTWEEHAFVGDLVASQSHSWLEIGRTDAWLERLAEIEAMRPRFVHPGRGRSGGPETLAAERAYLEAVIQLVAAEKPVLPVDPTALARVQAELERRFPGYAFPVFLKIGLPAEWRRQAAGT